MCSRSSGYVSACVVMISKRLSKTRDWIVAIKSLLVVHRVLIDGHPSFGEEIVYATRRGMRVLNLSDFRDEAHSNSWDYVGFVRFYSLYLDEMIEIVVYERKVREGNEGNSDHGRERREIPLRSMQSETLLEKLTQLLQMLDRVLACRPTGMAKSSRLVSAALYLVVKESFGLYVEICEALGVLLDYFKKMDYGDCVRAFDVYVSAAKKIDELVGFYAWCKDMGIMRSSEFPEVQRITNNLLDTLEGFVKEMRRRPEDFNEKKRGDEKVLQTEDPEHDMNEIKALPPPENYAPLQSVSQSKLQHQHTPQLTKDLVNLREDRMSVDEQSNKLALALFSGQPVTKTDGSWETFSSNQEPVVTSAWQTPAAEAGKADWEVALVETNSNLSKQKADLGGGFDPLLLNGMYDQGTIRQHMNTEQLIIGSSSSVALPGQSKAATQVLALPAPDGTVQSIGPQDPFAASLSVPPPSYVQIAEMEKKQQLLVQEQLLWQQYGRDGMHGQVGLTKIAGGSAAYIGLNPQAIAHNMGLQGGSYNYGPY